MDALDLAIVAATQAGLPLDPEPYRIVAERLGVAQQTVLERMRAMLASGVLRRIGAVPNHYALGYVANGMTVWDVDDARVDELGARIGELAFVSHCYRRPRHGPRWPYNLFAMVHGKSRTETQAQADAIAALLGDACRARDILYSSKILKKTGIRIHDSGARGQGPEARGMYPRRRRGNLIPGPWPLAPSPDAWPLAPDKESAMFRITRYLQETVTPEQAPRERGAPKGPVVIWNLVRRCNLTCRHCYSISADRDFPGELSTAEVFRVMSELRAFGVPALILSGGEPLLHPDIFDIAARAKALGFYVGLSSNGTLINDGNIDDIAAAGFDYVGVSLDGLRDTHDRFRRKAGAFDAALAGLRLAHDVGAKVGLRFTLTQDNAHDLPALLDLMESEGIDRFYLSHLNYAGRGERNRARDPNFDAYARTTRAAMNLLFTRCLHHILAGKPREFVSGNNDADGVYLLHWIERHFPARAPRLRESLLRWGGNASGVNIANIDNLGNVHPDTMWWDYPLGNVRERSFADIWNDVSDPVMAGLKAHPRPVQGRCAKCAHRAICNGNTRVRAWHASGNLWGEDPGCYLDDDEIGLAPAQARAVEDEHEWECS
jgi:heme d1 biosynthesis radical SAM protein NirJ